MASSEARKPNYPRRFAWLLVFIVILFGGYSAAWYYAAGVVQGYAADFIRTTNRGGTTLACGNARVVGFPFRIGVFCDDFHFGQAGEVTVAAGDFRSVAQVYNPFLIISELDSPTEISIAGAGTIGLDWANLRASVRLATPIPERISLEARDLTATAALGGDTARELFRAVIAAAHMRPNGADIDYAGNFTDVSINPALIQGGTLPPLSGAADIGVKDGVALLGRGLSDLRGVAVVVRSLGMSAGSANIQISGPVSVGDDGLVEATLIVKALNPAEIGQIAARAFPAHAEQINSSFSGLAALGPNAELPLTVRKGAVSLGFIPLGQIPPLLAR